MGHTRSHQPLTDLYPVPPGPLCEGLGRVAEMRHDGQLLLQTVRTASFVRSAPPGFLTIILGFVSCVRRIQAAGMLRRVGRYISTFQKNL